MDLDVGAIELVVSVAALGHTVADGSRRQTFVVHGTVEKLRCVAHLKRAPTAINIVTKR